MTTNGTVETDEEATVYIKDLDMFFCVKLVDDSPAVLLLTMSGETMGLSHFWTTVEQPILTKDGIKDDCRSETMSHWSQ